MIDGLDETIKALQKLGQLDTKQIKDMLKKEGGKIVMDAKARCTSSHISRAIELIQPNSDKYPTSVLIGVNYNKPGLRGRANDSISYKSRRSGGGRFIVRESITLYKLADIWEFGSAPRWTKDGSYRGAFSARPFMRPAFESNKSQIRDSIKNNLISIIEKQAKKNNLK